MHPGWQKFEVLLLHNPRVKITIVISGFCQTAITRKRLYTSFYWRESVAAQHLRMIQRRLSVFVQNPVTHHGKELIRAKWMGLPHINLDRSVRALHWHHADSSSSTSVIMFFNCALMRKRKWTFIGHWQSVIKGKFSAAN